jgi:hypothetical protein
LIAAHMCLAAAVTVVMGRGGGQESKDWRKERSGRPSGYIETEQAAQQAKTEQP